MATAIVSMADVESLTHHKPLPFRRNDVGAPATTLHKDVLNETMSGIHLIIDTSRYSSSAKLLSVTAYVYRFLQNVRKDKPRIVGPISATEKQAALKLWIQNCQTLHYTSEIANLTSSSSTRLPLVRQLRLFLDHDGFLRCGGRIHNAPLSELAKFPYLLPKNCRFTELIVQDANRKQLHYRSMLQSLHYDKVIG